MEWNTCPNMSNEPRTIRKYEMSNLPNIFPDITLN